MLALLLLQKIRIKIQSVNARAKFKWNKFHMSVTHKIIRIICISHPIQMGANLLFTSPWTFFYIAHFISLYLFLSRIILCAIFPHRRRTTSYRFAVFHFFSRENNNAKYASSDKFRWTHRAPSSGVDALYQCSSFMIYFRFNYFIYFIMFLPIFCIWMHFLISFSSCVPVFFISQSSSVVVLLFSTLAMKNYTSSYWIYWRYHC